MMDNLIGLFVLDLVSRLFWVPIFLIHRLCWLPIEQRAGRLFNQAVRIPILCEIDLKYCEFKAINTEEGYL